MKLSLASFLTILLPAILLLASCGDEEAKMGKGFRLPEGDVARGKTAFTDLQCTQCHSVKGSGLPEVADKSAVHFDLGGEVRKVKTYGQLVTAIIQPQHIVSPDYLATLEEEKKKGAVSPMPDFNQTMTVAQMTDIVTFLHAHYETAMPTYDEYPYYGP